MSNETWMVIFGILCVALSGVLFYGVTRRDYYFRIDTFDMVQRLTGWNTIDSFFGAMGLALLVLFAGIFLIGIGIRR